MIVSTAIIKDLRLKSIDGFLIELHAVGLIGGLDLNEEKGTRNYGVPGKRNTAANIQMIYEKESAANRNCKTSRSKCRDTHTQPYSTCISCGKKIE